MSQLFCVFICKTAINKRLPNDCRVNIYLYIELYSDTVLVNALAYIPPRCYKHKPHSIHHAR